jgi:hypothetical protein
MVALGERVGYERAKRKAAVEQMARLARTLMARNGSNPPFVGLSPDYGFRIIPVSPKWTHVARRLLAVVAA